MPPKEAAKPAGKAEAIVEPLNDEEFQFVWRSLVEEGKLTMPNLKRFLYEVTGTKLSSVQAKDLLNYMDMNGDGRVGQEDFRAFLQTSCLGMTDPGTFMWRSKSKWRQEHGARGSVHEQEEEKGFFQLTQGQAQPAKPPPQAAAPAAGNAGGGGASSSTRAGKAARAAQSTNEATISRIDRIVAGYEKETWDRLLIEEDVVLRDIFAQFAQREGAKAEVTEMDATGFHKMVTKWHPMAQWSTSSTIRPADSLATMHFLNAQSKGGAPPAGAEGATDGEAAADASAEGLTEVKVPYGVFRDCVRGKKSSAASE